jgi:hypothetical protein
VALGAVLLTAAGLKAQQLATEPVAGTDLLSTRWFLIAVVEGELAGGLWLWAGLFPKWTRRGALAGVALLAMVAAYRGWSGADSCGCFGRVRLNPWWTFAGDLAFLAALARWRPAGAAVPADRHGNLPRAAIWRRAAAIGLICLTVGGPGGWALATLSPGQLSAAGEIPAEGRVTLLQPEQWVGQAFPLLKHIEPDEPLATGRWQVILYHHGCPKCEQLLADIESSLASADPSSVQRLVALIEVPPYESDQIPESVHPAVLHGRLTNDREWFVSTPASIELDEGRVVDVNDPAAGLGPPAPGESGSSSGS